MAAVAKTQMARTSPAMMATEANRQTEEAAPRFPLSLLSTMTYLAPVLTQLSS